MILQNLRKVKKIEDKKETIRLIIDSLKIDTETKKLYLRNLEKINSEKIDVLFKNIYTTIEDFETQKVEDMNKKISSKLLTIKKQEKEEQQKELEENLSLLNNL